VGTAAVETPGVIQCMCEELGPDAVVVGVDARNGYVAVRGWTQTSGILATDLARQMADTGVRRLLYTDIARDGTLTEPNFHAIGSFAAQTRAHVIAAGGISSVHHLRRLADQDIEAAIVGKALYTGAIDLSEALKAVRQDI